MASEDLDRLIKAIVQEAGYGDRRLFDSLSDHEKQALFKIINELEQSGKSSTFDLLWEKDYEHKPVSIDTFLDDPYYMGTVGRQVYDRWKIELRHVLDPGQGIIEWITTGAIGTGKTTVTILALLYKAYCLMCLRNPQRYYNLMEGHAIYFGLFNLTMNLVQSVSYEKLITSMRISPFFKEAAGIRHKLNPRDSETLNLPKNIAFAFGSSVLHALGENTFGGLMSEVNFSKSSEYKQVYDLYSGVKRRMESRFMRPGMGVPGLLVIDSSKRDEGDWLENHLRSSANIKSVHVTTFALWDVKKYSEKKFPVIVGDRARKSVVVENDDQIPPETPKDKIIHVPIDFWESFIRDVEGSLRDVAGIATYAFAPLIYDRSKVFECIDQSRHHPFLIDQVTLSTDDPLSLLEQFQVNEMFQVIDPYNRTYRLKLNPGFRRYIHADLALTGDAGGLAMCHIPAKKVVERTKPDGTITKVAVPHIVIDFMVRITRPRGGEIDFGKVIEFIYIMRNMGVPVGMVTFDKFQSAHLIQSLKKNQFESKVVSVDRKADAYISLRDAIYERRVSFYDYQPFVHEITTVQFNRARYKVDHPVGGSKDVADAVAGSVFAAMTDQLSEANAMAPIENRLDPDERLPVEVMMDNRWVSNDYRDGEYITRVMQQMW